MASLGETGFQASPGGANASSTVNGGGHALRVGQRRRVGRCTLAQGPAIHRLVDVGPDAAPADIVLGPDHPTLDGLPRARRGRHGWSSAAEWLAGTVHRGAEKLFESRDYRQIIMLVDRHDWLSAFCSEIGVVVGVERALGLTPPRAQHLRILLCELTRIAHHLAFLAPLPGPLPERWREGAWAWREEILGLLEGATGHRVHPMFCQVGGVRADVPDQWVRGRGGSGRILADGPLPSLDGPELAGLLDARYAGVAPLTRRQALGFGASGPVGRASGVDLDLRRDDPYLPYPPFEVPLATEGDARARVRMLVAELATSVALVGWAAEQVAAAAASRCRSACPRSCACPRAGTTPGPRTRRASTATCSSRATTARPGVWPCARPGSRMPRHWARPWWARPRRTCRPRLPASCSCAGTSTDEPQGVRVLAAIMVLFDLLTAPVSAGGVVVTDGGGHGARQESGCSRR